jgi:hypothetical protein
MLTSSGWIRTSKGQSCRRPCACQTAVLEPRARGLLAPAQAEALGRPRRSTYRGRRHTARANDVRGREKVSTPTAEVHTLRAVSTAVSLDTQIRPRSIARSRRARATRPFGHRDGQAGDDSADDAARRLKNRIRTLQALSANPQNRHDGAAAGARRFRFSPPNARRTRPSTDTRLRRISAVSPELQRVAPCSRQRQPRTAQR